MQQAQPQNARDDQKGRHDVIEQLRHDEDQDAGDQGDNRLEMGDADSNCGFPFLDDELTARSFGRKAPRELF